MVVSTIAESWLNDNFILSNNLRLTHPFVSKIFEQVWDQGLNCANEERYLHNGST